MFDTFQIVVKEFEVLNLDGFDNGKKFDEKTNNYYLYYKKHNALPGLNLIYVTLDKLKVQFSQKILEDYPRSITIKDMQYIQDKINSLGFVFIHNIFDAEIKRIDYVYSIDAECKTEKLKELILQYSGKYPKKVYKSSLVIDSNPRFTIYDKLEEDKKANEATKEFYEKRLRAEVQIRGREQLKKYFYTKIKKTKRTESLRGKKKKEIETAYSDGILIKDIKTFKEVELRDYINNLFTKFQSKNISEMKLNSLISEIGKNVLLQLYGSNYKTFIKSKLKNKNVWKRYLPKVCFLELKNLSL